MKEMTQKIIDIAAQKGRITSADLVDIGASRTSLAYLASRGILRRIARGIYVPAGHIANRSSGHLLALSPS